MSARFIADLHLFDVYSMDWRNHLVSSLDAFANMLIAEWNSVTDNDDIVIIAGDIGNYCSKTIDVLRMLKGKKVLVYGNHDVPWRSAKIEQTIFIGIYEELLTNGVYIKHRPEFDSEIRSKASYIVHGHHHYYHTLPMRNHLIKYANDIHRYNCACDLIGYKPRTLQELAMHKELLLDKFKTNNFI